MQEDLSLFSIGRGEALQCADALKQKATSMTCTALLARHSGEAQKSPVSSSVGPWQPPRKAKLLSRLLAGMHQTLPGAAESIILGQAYRVLIMSAVAYRLQKVLAGMKEQPSTARTLAEPG